MSLLFLFSVFSCFLFFSSFICTVSISISNGDRRDVNGVILDAHDSKFYYHAEDGLFYWFAASYGSCIEPSGNTGCANMTIGACGFRSDHNVTLFVSPNLRDWENRGVVFEAKNQLPADSTFFAPKTVYNKKNQEWVMWMNYLVNNFGNSYYGVATSKSAEGPFKLVVDKVTTLAYPDQGDENLFVDDNGDAYIIYTTIAHNHAVSVEKLTDDYYYTLGANASSGFIGADNCEAPMMFKRHNLYYAVFGTTCCYCESGTPVTAYVASSPMGPYSVAGYLGDLHSQSTDIFLYPDDSGDVQALYVGDHWQSAPDHRKGHDKSVFAPLIFSSDGLSVKTNGYQDSFTINIQVNEKHHDIAMQQ